MTDDSAAEMAAQTGVVELDVTHLGMKEVETEKKRERDGAGKTAVGKRTAMTTGEGGKG